MKDLTQNRTKTSVDDADISTQCQLSLTL